jgi:GGDEF domain-containing protein
MNVTENTVWAVMAGGLLSLVLLTAIDAVVTRSMAAMRSLLLITAISGVCVLLSGLPETLFPELPPRLGVVLKAGLGPLAGALGLRLLGIWIGGYREDPIVYRITISGCMSIAAAGVALMVLAALAQPEQYPHLLVLTAALTAIPALLCLLVALRAAFLGDALARWLVLASLFLLAMVSGLYLRALDVAGFGLGMWIFTAASAVVFVLIVMVLIVQRNRTNRDLARLARLESGNDPATGLPTGARLVSEVEHTFWRTGRMHGRCVVVGLYLSNLYELTDPMGRSIDSQILSATAARVRRAAGFRCAVGLYHPRCFIVAFSVERGRVMDPGALALRFRSMVSQPLQVVTSDNQQQTFVPQIGLAVLTVLPHQVPVQDAIDEAEHHAMDDIRHPVPRIADDLHTTLPAHRGLAG